MDMTDKAINPEISHHFVMCDGEPSQWSVCIVPNINSCESAEQIEQQILLDRAKMEALEKTKGSMERIIDGLDYGSMKEEVELLKHIQSILDTGIKND